MAARGGRPVGNGAILTTTINGAEVRATVTPSLNLEGLNAPLLKTITDVNGTNLVQATTLNNTFLGIRQYHYGPTFKNQQTTIINFTVPDWCYTDDLHIQFQVLFCAKSNTIWANGGLAAKLQELPTMLLQGNYAGNPGGIFNLFRNVKIKIGQTDIMTTFEKSPIYWQLFNSTLKGRWDQDIVYGLINEMRNRFNCNTEYGLVENSAHKYLFENEHPRDKWLSKIIAYKNVTQFGDGGAGVGASITALENIAIPLSAFHQAFQQRMIIPPNTPFSFEFEHAGCSLSDAVDGYDALVAGPATFARIFALSTTAGNPIIPPVNFNTDFINYAQIGVAECGWILGSVVWACPQNGIHIHSHSMRPEIALQYQTVLQNQTLVINYTQYLSQAVTNYIANILNYDCVLPTNTAVPCQYMFYWAPTRGFICAQRALLGFDGGWPNVAVFPGAPLPVVASRFILSRHGYRELILINTYYMTNLTEKLGYCYTIADGDPGAAASVVTCAGQWNLTGQPTYRFMDRLVERGWNIRSVSGLTGQDQLWRHHTMMPFQYGSIWTLQLTPEFQDTGLYSADQTPYTVTIKFEIDQHIPLDRHLLFDAQDIKLYCIRVQPCQMLIDPAKIVTQVTWPRFAIDTNGPVLGNAALTNQA